MPRRRNRPGGQTRLRPRTLNAVEETFARMRVQRVSRYSGILPAYIRCRMDPFSFNLGGAGTPDSALVPRVVVDHRDFANLTIGTSGTCQVRLFPCLPFPLAFKSLGADWAGFAINGTSVAAATVSTATTAANYGWMPLIRVGEWANWSDTAAAAAIGVEVPGPYSEAKARIVSLGVKIFYTGAASTAAGTVTVTVDRGVASDVSSSSKNIETWSSSVAGSTIAPGFFSSVDFGGITPVMDANTITERPEVALRIVPRRLDVAKPWLDRFQVPYYPIEGVSTYPIFTKMVVGTIPLIGLWDDMWEIPCITFSGVAAGSVYRFETAVCVEYQPMVTSSISKLAKKPGKVVSSDTLDKVEAGLTVQPVATAADVSPNIGQVLQHAGRPDDTGPKPKRNNNKQRARAGKPVPQQRLPQRASRLQSTRGGATVTTTTVVRRPTPNPPQPGSIFNNKQGGSGRPKNIPPSRRL